MKISIITATFNSAATIRDTLNSIAEQTYSNIEHIIVDGLSKDNTLEIVRSFPSVSKIICEKDAGIYDAMNKGLRVATGEVIGILNSDDFYAHKDVISSVVNYFNTIEMDTVYGDLQYVDSLSGQKVVRNWVSKPYNKANFYKGWMPPHPTFFVRRGIYEKYGCFDTNLGTAADYELMLRFLLRYEVSSCYLSELLVKMREGGESNKSWRNRINAHLNDKLAWKRNGLVPKFYTFALKPLSKLPQFLPYFLFDQQNGFVSDDARQEKQKTLKL